MTLTRKRGPCTARNSKTALKSYKNLLRRTAKEQWEGETTYDEENTVTSTETVRATHQVTTGQLQILR
jgi:hypothetical protein